MPRARVIARNLERAERRQAIRRIAAKRAFWRHVWYLLVFNLAFWLSWLIGGVRDGWVAPWPVVPTVAGGLFLLYRVHRLGGMRAVGHAAIADEVADLRRRELEIPAGFAPVSGPVSYANPVASTPPPRIHLSDIIDLRDHRGPAASIGPGRGPTRSESG